MPINNPSTRNSLARSYSSVIDLLPGQNTVNHNLNLLAPFAVIVRATDTRDGSEILLRVSQLTANSCNLNLITQMDNVIIKIN